MGTKTEGGEAFFKAFDAPEDKLKKASAAELMTEVVACPPDGFKMTRTYTNGSESKSYTHEIKVGSPCEIEGPLGKKHTFNISKDGDKFVAKAAKWSRPGPERETLSSDSTQRRKRALVCTGI